MTTPDYQGQLREAAARLGLRLSAEECESLLTYVGQLQRWNRTYNLTALRAAGDMLVHHIFDSLAVVGPLREALSGKADEVRVVDVGSGGGLPGVVLAIMNPGWKVHCVDAVEKKTAFVRQMTAVLGLANLQAVHARVETLPLFNADVVISRAFASLEDFSSLAGQHVIDDGWLVAMKGKEPVEEIRALHTTSEWNVERIQSLDVPYLDAQRCLLWISRQGNP